MQPICLLLFYFEFLPARVPADYRSAWAIQSMSSLVERFNDNVEASTLSFEKVVRDPGDVAGLPPSMLYMAAKSYVTTYARGLNLSSESGPWRFTLESDAIDILTRWTLLKHLDSRSMRKTMFLAFASRASHGAHDNRAIISEILHRRWHQGRLAGYSNFAEWKARSQMLGTVAVIDQLLSNLSAALRPVVAQDLEQIHTFAVSNGHNGKLEPWDVDYWEESLRKQKYGYDEEALLAYFSLPRVLASLFNLTSSLFSIFIQRDEALETKLQGQAQFPKRSKKKKRAHLMCFHISDADTREHLGSFYINPHANEAEGTSTVQRRSTATGQKPVELIDLNIPKPAGSKPSLMRLQNIESLFHEFGHVLATIFTDRYEFSQTERDNMEIPSCFFECWMFHTPTFDAFALHYATGEPLPSDQFVKIVKGALFGSARRLLWSVTRAALDMELHARWSASAEEAPHDVEHRIVTAFSGLPRHPDECWVCIFDHVFDGDHYAANEYSYLWGQVVAFDAYQVFRDLENKTQFGKVGRHFRETLLGTQKTRSLLDVYREFRGRDATINALLKFKVLGSDLDVCENQL